MPGQHRPGHMVDVHQAAVVVVPRQVGPADTQVPGQRAAQYNPLEMASGATDLINEAATAKITGEEERYSNTDFPVFQANVDGAMEVVSLLQPYLQHKDPSLLDQIRQRHAAVTALLAKYKASPATTAPAAT